MTTFGWLLIVFINGSVHHMVPVNGPDECFARSHFELRYEPRAIAYCHFGPEIKV